MAAPWGRGHSFFSSPKQRQKVQLGEANSQAVSSKEQPWDVQILAQRNLAWLAPQDDQQQKCCSKTSVKFSKVGYCHFVSRRQTCAHIDFQQERWSAFPELLLAFSFPKTLPRTIQIITLLHAWWILPPQTRQCDTAFPWQTCESVVWLSCVDMHLISNSQQFTVLGLMCSGQVRLQKNPKWGQFKQSPKKSQQQ